MNRISSPNIGRTISVPPSRWLAALLIKNLIVAGLYWAVAVLVRWYFSHYAMWPAPLWLSSSIAMYAAFVMGRYAALGILLGSFLTNIVSFHGSLLSSSRSNSRTGRRQA